jgi:transcriptional regulator with XRE-family HTH domain
MNIGANIKAIREKKGLTQTQLANLIGTSQQKISVWENSERELTVTTVVKIANALEVDISELLQTSNEFQELNTKCDIAQNPQPHVVGCGERKDSNLDEYKKQISEERELLHRQLELLAERSKHCTDNKELAELSVQMVSIYTTLKNVNCHR